MGSLVFPIRTAVILAVLFSTAACSRNESNSPVSPSAFLKKASTLSREIWISKNNPSTGDVWTAGLKRSGGDETEWMILSAPGGKTLLDQHGDSIFINHLLSLMESLQLTEENLTGPLASFGLERPLFYLKLIYQDEPPHGLKVGDPVEGNGGNYAIALLDTQPGKVSVARGGALQMMGLIEKFDVLRRRTLLTLTTDDVDVLELFQEKRKTLFAERAGSQWHDSKDHLLKQDVTAKLEGLTHLRIQEFIDSPTDADRLIKSIEHSAQFRAIFKDRSNHPTELKVWVNSGQTYATLSSRAGAVFILYPDSLRYWTSR